MKICTKCNKEKSKDDFSKNSHSKSGLQPTCKPCQSEYYFANFDKKKIQRQHRYAENKELIAQKSKQYRDANKEKVMQGKKRYAEENAQKLRDKKRLYYAENKEKILERNKKYRIANKEMLAEKNRIYRENNPELISSHKRNRRAVKRLADGSHLASDVKRIFDAQRGLCANCNSKLFKSGVKKYHVDHIMPLSLGGSNWPSNLQCLCPSCNLSKGSKHPDDWAVSNGKLL